MAATHSVDGFDLDSLWNFDDPAASEQSFRAALPAHSNDLSLTLEIKTQIARTLGLRQQFDHAHAVLDSVEGQLDKVDERVRVRYLLERGRVFNSSNQQDKATPLFAEALKVAQAASIDFLAVDAAHMLGIAAPTDERMKWNLKALKLAEASQEPKARKWCGSLYNNIGWTYFEEKKYDSALAMFEKAVTFRVAQQKPTEVRIAKWCVAKALRYLNKVDSALAMQQQLLKDWEASSEKADGYVYEEIGECLLIKGKAGDAKPYFAKAYELLSADPWLSRDEPDRLARLKELGG